MATPSERDLTHPVTAFVCATKLRLDTLVNAPTRSMDGTAVAAALGDLATITAQLASPESGVITQADTLALPAGAGCRTTTQWLAMTTHVTTSTASHKTRLARALTAHPDTAAALACGTVHAEQAIAITGAVDALENLDHIEETAIERHCLDLAGDHDAQQLGLRSLEVLDPVRADELESQALERQEARARKKTHLSLYDDGTGLSHGSFTMPTAQASMLRKALIALGTPKHVRGTQGAGTYDHQTPTPQKLGHAREAGVIPAWMDTSTGTVLSLGGKHRLHQPHQRLALVIERDHCEHPGCQTPARLCHVHHTTAWSAGGHTDTDTAVTPCPFHHHQAHATGATYPMRT